MPSQSLRLQYLLLYTAQLSDVDSQATVGYLDWLQAPKKSFISRNHLDLRMCRHSSALHFLQHKSTQLKDDPMR